MSEWIKTSERLPEHKQRVLVVYNGEVRTALYTNDGFGVDVDWWMPLPELPGVIMMFTTKEQAVREWNKSINTDSASNWVTEYNESEPVVGKNVVTLKRKI